MTLALLQETLMAFMVLNADSHKSWLVGSIEELGSKGEEKIETIWIVFSLMKKEIPVINVSWLTHNNFLVHNNGCHDFIHFILMPHA